MTGRKALVGLSLLCALAFAAFSAGSASAATSGTTAFTCVAAPASSGDFGDAHCDTTSVNSNFAHASISPTTEHVISTNAATKNSTTESTIVVLEGTVVGITTKLEGATVSGTGTLENVMVNEEHKIKGTGIKITYTGVKVVNPANCQVHSPGQAAETIVTNTLESESVVGTPMTQKFFPAGGGTELAKLEFENKAPGTCINNNKTATVTGTVSAEPSGQAGQTNHTGATLNVNVTKGSAQLKVGGQNASLTALETIKMESGNPIASTGP